jgi:hypothetical protein
MMSTRRPAAIGLALILFAAAAAPAPGPSPRERVITIVTKIQRADYEGDRPALKRLYEELEPFVGESAIASRVRYWRGFALWRRAINGFNDSTDPEELEADATQALVELGESTAQDPDFVDAKVGSISCLGILMYLGAKDPKRVAELLARSRPMVGSAEQAAPDNPRLLWVMGAIRWVVPPERGGGQDKAIATYHKGLESVRKERAPMRRDPLEPSWGEPELLMSLAWSHLNATKPDLVAAESYARSALALVPDWHYVRDILLSQVQKAKAKRQ